MKFFPIKIHYRIIRDDLVVFLCGRDEHGRRRKIKLLGTRPYFFAPDPVDHPLVVESVPNASKNLRGESVHRIYTKFPFDVPDVRATTPINYEADITYDMRIRYDHGIRNCIDIPDQDVIEPDDIKPIEGNIAPRVWALDIETLPKKGSNTFTDPKYPTDPVVLVTVHDSVADKFLTVFNGHLTEPQRATLEASLRDFGITNYQLVVVSDERQLFGVLKHAFETIGPDIVHGWNAVAANMIGSRRSSGYDRPYLENRARQHNMPRPFWDDYAWIDTMAAYLRLHDGDLPSWSLDYVAKEEGLPGKTIKRAWEFYDSEPEKYIFYNIVDVWLAKEIEKKKGLIDFNLRLAKYAGASVESADSNARLADAYVFHRLKDVAVQVTRHFSDSDIAEEEIQGGLVFDSQPGIHTNDAELDLKQEYPSLMRTFNMSPETLVDDSYTGPVFTLPTGSRYRKEPRGIFPTILDEMSAERDAITDKDQSRVVKFFMNSFFGILKSLHYRNRHTTIAGDITHMARLNLQWNRDVIARTEPDTTVIYGDSVPEDEPILVRHPNGVINIIEIQEATASYEVWSDEGFTPIRRVIKKPSTKPIHTIRTPTGVVHVTSDHSLLRSDGSVVKPMDLAPGDDLLHHSVGNAATKTMNNSITKDGAWLLGAFVADGSCGTYTNTTSTKSSWAINKADVSHLETCQRILKDEFGIDTKIEQTMKSSGCYKLRPHGNPQGTITPLTRAFRSMCYTTSGHKRIPSTVLNAPEHIQASFFDGYYAGDGDKKNTHLNNPRSLKMTTNSPVLAAGLTYLLQRLGRVVTVNTRIRKDGGGEHEYFNIYAYTREEDWRTKRRLPPTSLERILPRAHSCLHVYDLETDNHHFSAGIGDLVVHNTDSCHVALPPTLTETESKTRANRMVDAVNASLSDFARQYGADSHCLKVKLEDVYPRILWGARRGDAAKGAKKRYALLVADPDGDIEGPPHGLEHPHYSMKIRGFEFRRSDAPPLTRRAQEDLFKLLLLTSGDRDAVVTYVRDLLSKVRDGTIPVSDLCVPKGWRTLSERPTQQQRAAMWSNEHLGKSFRVGGKVNIYFGHVRGLPPTDVFALEWDDPLPKDAVVDVDRHIQRALIGPLEPILGLVGLSWFDVDTGTIATTTAQF